MVNKLLIGVGIVALVAVGSIGVWQLADGEGDRRAGALSGEPISEEEAVKGAIRWRGAFTKEAAYEPLDVVSYEGSSYIARKQVREVPPPDEPWDLLAQAGAAGAQGPAGSSSGAVQSPNGDYSLVVANDGIVMNGPGGTIALRDNVLELSGQQAMTIVVGGNMTADIGGSAAVSTGGAMNAEVGGSMALDVSGNVAATFGQGVTAQAGGIVNLRGTILRLNCPAGGSLVAGSQTVRVC